MKIRAGHVSNSSSTSFYITNKWSETLTLADFASETLYLVDQFVEEYDSRSSADIESIRAEFLEDAKKREEVIPPGTTTMEFGDEDGDVLGRVYDYILRDGGETQSFSWSFHEWRR